MATIAKIREKRNLLLIIIIIAMLLFLLPYDAIMSFFVKDEVGEVNGGDISVSEWTSQVQKRQMTNLNYPNNQMENAVWSDVIEKRLLGDDYSELGIDVSDEELEEITLGTNPSSFVLSTFHGGNVTEQTMQNYGYHMDRIETKEGQVALINLIKNKRKREKWENLVKKGLYANSLEAKYNDIMSQEKVDVEYVLAKFTDIPDSIISLDDSDIRAYFNKHKQDPEYKVARENRDVKYVEFVIEPSEKDIAFSKEQASKLANTWSNAENDTLFAQANKASFNDITYKDATFSGPENDSINVVPVGTVIGPFQTDKVKNKHIIVKVTGRDMVPDSSRVRHILFKVQNTMQPQDITDLKEKAEGVMADIKSGKVKFEDAVTEFSEDQGSLDKGGDYGWFDINANYVQPYKDFAFERNKGDIDIVQSNFGYHLMEVVDQSPKTQVSTKYKKVETDIVASIETKKEVFRMADEFSLSCNNNMVDFETAAEEKGISVLEGNNIYRTNQSVGKLQNAGRLISWMYNTNKVGTVSQPQETQKSYVVAVMNKIKKAGIPEYENVKEEMEVEVMKEKKGEMYAKMMDLNSLQEVADAVGGAIKTARGISLNSANLSGSGVSGADPEVVGLAHGIAVGEMSSPIVGEFGIYVIAPATEKTAATIKEQYVTEQDGLITSAQNSFNQVYSSMTSKAKVADTRFDN